MSPEEEAQLRHLIRKGKELPQPTSQLFKRATKRYSKAGQILKKTEVEKNRRQQKRDAKIAEGRKK